ncbi:MAG: DNA cytosine methyltransferase [Chloroflexota bacterium]|nr:DNA cytosine methyltransferase [Chloroflexota bacterium]
MRLIDLFCGAGGAAMGYYRAGFGEIVGVDIRPQPRYPFECIQADAMTFPLAGFDAVHASPPCQGYSVMRNLPWLRDRVYPLLLEPTLERLAAQETPWVVENVMGARRILHAGWLCGTMFGLPFPRHRLFGSSFFWLAPAHAKHGALLLDLPMGHATHRDIGRHRNPVHTRAGAALRHARGWRVAAELMGIDWMTRDELTQAIPPAYTEYIGRHLLDAVRAGA